MSWALERRGLLVIGASAGIGRALAIRAVQDGADVVLVGRRADRLDEAVVAAGGGHPIVADITSVDDCKRLVAEAAEHLGTIDAIVIASGVGGLARLRDTTPDEWRTVFEVNVIGPSMVVAAALPHLPPGAFVGFVSSESVGRPRTGLVPYSSSKAALEESVRGWREEHPEIRFCTMRVGATQDTEFSRDFDFSLAGDLFPSWINHGHMAAMMMEPAEVGGALAAAVAGALAHPGVDVQDVTIRPPGPLMTPATDTLMESLEAHQAAHER
jgi:NAD(P)-dependent dehydrogenase (short-subunit alcohol dehydrogenase family)